MYKQLIISLILLLPFHLLILIMLFRLKRNLKKPIKHVRFKCPE